MSVARDREHLEARSTVEEFPIVLAAGLEVLAYDDNVRSGLSDRHADIGGVLYPAGNRHFGASRDNRGDGVEKQSGHACEHNAGSFHGTAPGIFATRDARPDR